MASDDYELSVFVNCPFDRKYKSTLFPAILFTIYDCGLKARSALEADTATSDRLEKIFEIVKSSKYGIHDISRTGLDRETRLPRFNMPLELGIFLAAQKYGAGRQKEKICLVLDRERYRYHKFISDIKGRDISAHNNKIDSATRRVRDWLNDDKPQGVMLPGHVRISTRYETFRKQLPRAAKEAGLDPTDLRFNDIANFVSKWIELNPKE